MNKKRMNAMLGGVTALCMTCSMMSSAVVFAQDHTFEEVEESQKVVQEANLELNFEGANTVYYHGQYFATLVEGLKAAYMDTTTTGVKEIHCKAGADVGTMTHGHVADDVIIYGHGAYVSGGERDLEVDTFKYDRTTGAQSQTGQYLEKDVTVTVKDLNGIAAWGQRNTNHKITLNFENCKNMHRVYFSGTTGNIEINLNHCSFNANGDEQGNLKSYNSPIYSNANGVIYVENCEFNDVDIPINLNHKAAGEQTIQVKNTTFTNCGLATDPNTKTYSAPIRIVAQPGATSNLSVENCDFIYTEGKTNCGNGDILLGDGRNSAKDQQGTVTLSMSETKADVMVQKKGYYAADGTVASQDNAKTTTVQENEVVNKQEVTVDKPIQPQPAPDSGSGSGGGSGSTVQVNPVYRAYNPNNGEHLYTLDEKEYQHVASVGWQAEGVAFMAETEQNGQALYRVYNPNSGLHHYTLDEHEKNVLVSLGWNDENVAWYTSKKPQSAPVFRVYNPNDGNHHYTMNKQEKDTLVSLGWNDEGIAFRTAPIETK